MIETERLIIRHFNETDDGDLFEYLSLPQTYIYEPGEPVNAEEARKIAAERAKGDEFYAVVLKSQMKMIGHLSFIQIEPKKFFTWELGYIFNPDYHNQGYASEASKAFVHYAFTTFKIHRITAHCNTQNIASWKLLEKIGMRREGHFIRNAYFKKDDNNNPIWVDSYQYAMLNDSE